MDLVWNDGTTSLYAGNIAKNLYTTSYSWLVPVALTAGNQYRIRICEVNAALVRCNETPNFTISNSLIPQPVLRVKDDGSGINPLGEAPSPTPGSKPVIPNSGAANVRPFNFF